MTRICGNCVFSDKGGDKVVWCFGAPPTVISATPAENGGQAVAVQAPLIPAERRACGVHRYRWGLRGLFWKATGG